jgi:hypothetical protein
VGAVLLGQAVLVEGGLSLILSSPLRGQSTNFGAATGENHMNIFSNHQRTQENNEQRDKSKPRRTTKFWLILLKGVLAIVRFIAWLIDHCE